MGQFCTFQDGICVVWVCFVPFVLFASLLVYKRNNTVPVSHPKTGRKLYCVPIIADHKWNCQSISLLLFLQKQNLATAIYLFGLGTLLTGLGLKHMRICSHHDLIGALVTSLFPGGPWWSTTSPTCLPLSVFTITSDQHRCRIPPLL